MSLPVFLLVEMFGPIAEVLGYTALLVAWLTGTLNGPATLLMLAVAASLGIAQSVAAIALQEYAFRRYRRIGDVALLIFLTIIENVGYHQLSVAWRLHGLWKFLRKDNSWGEMTRTGFTDAARGMSLFWGAGAGTDDAALCRAGLGGWGLGNSPDGP